MKGIPYGQRLARLALAALLAVSLAPSAGRTAHAAVMPRVAAGNGYSLALKADGTLWAWGDNQYGQLGTGTALPQSSAPVKIMDNAVHIAANNQTAYAQTADGRLWAWGAQPPLYPLFTPQAFMGDPNSIAWNGQGGRSVSNTHTLEIRDNGNSFWAWGFNTYGQLGNGTVGPNVTQEPDAVRIALLSGPGQLLSPDGKYEYAVENSRVTLLRYLGNELTPLIPTDLANLPVAKIGERAFADNPYIRSVIIPAAITAIGERAFANCANLVSASFEHTDALSITAFGNNVTTANNVFADHAANFTIRYRPTALNFTTPTWMGYPAAHDAATTDGATDEYAYNIAQNGDVYITQYLGDAAAVRVPATLDGKPVRHIERRAFENNTQLISLTIPSGVTLIGEQAFAGCDNLARVVIPATVTVIEDRAFALCAKLVNARFLHTDANELTIFGSQVFAGTAAAFSVTYPPNAKNFTTPLWKTYPAAPHSFASDFEYRPENNGVTIVKYKGSSAAPYIPAYFEEFPEYPVRRIESDAFENNASITHISLPDTVTAIGQWSFARCPNLVSVTIPASVTHIGNNAFSDNPQLVYARFKHANAQTLTAFGSNIFSGGARNFLILYPRNASGFTRPVWQGYPSQPDMVAESDFQYTTENNEVTITKYTGPASEVEIPARLGGNPVTRIAGAAFSNNSALVQVTIPPTVTDIGAQAFEYCANLSRVVIPGSVTAIGYRAFGHCTALTEAVIPASVQTIENAAFADCNRLYAAAFEHPDANRISRFGENVFGNAAQGFSIRHTPGAAGFTAPTWKGYPVAAAMLTSPDWEYTVLDGAVTLVKYIGKAATVAIPAEIDGYAVRKIGDDAFAKSNITGVIIPPSVTHIGARAFFGCWALSDDIIIPANVVSFGDEAFQGTRISTALFEHSDAAHITHFGQDVFYRAPLGPDGQPNGLFVTIIYKRDARGFTTPTWQGYHARPEGDPAQPLPSTPDAYPTRASAMALQLIRITGQQPQTNDRATLQHYGIVFNGMNRPLSSAILAADDTTYLPLRALGEELLGAHVAWDATDRVAVLAYKNTVVETFAGANQVVVDGVYRDIVSANPNARAFIHAGTGSMYVPVRAVSEAFGFEVHWEAATETIIING